MKTKSVFIIRAYLKCWRIITGHMICPLYSVTVPDRRRRIVPEVVVVRRWAVGVLGIWKGRVQEKGWDKGEGVSFTQFTSNLGPRWMDPVTARRVPSK
jgi:hypothetical protein